MPESENSNQIALSEQQRRFQSGALGVYKDFLIGDASWGKFIGFELYNLLLSGCPSIVGYGMRRIVLPLFLKAGGSKLTLGKGVSIRQPKNIALGKGVIIDDFSVLDVRATESEIAGIVLGDSVFIGRGTILAAKGGAINIEDGANISSSCRIATQSRVRVARGTLVGAYSYIGPGNHQTGDASKPIIEQGMEIKGGVDIGENCWIGARATILDGVTVGKNAVIGAHSLVKDDVPENAVVAGTPAKVIKVRDTGAESSNQ